MSAAFFREDFSNLKLLPQVWKSSHYPIIFLFFFKLNFLDNYFLFFSDLCERDETEVWLCLNLIEMQQICPFLLRMVTNMKVTNENFIPAGIKHPTQTERSISGILWVKHSYYW